MKFLLTSNGLSNASIAQALFDLVGKPAAETSIAFIPTAMNLSSGEKDWFVNDLVNIQKQGIKFFDIVEIAALPKNVWLPRLQKTDVLFFSGGSSFYLMHWIQSSGLAQELPELLQTRVYAGISAGSMVTNPSLALSSRDKKVYYEEVYGETDERGLSFVDFFVRPHFNSVHFPDANEKVLQTIALESGKTIYGLDDMSALKVINNSVEPVSEGLWKKFN